MIRALILCVIVGFGAIAAVARPQPAAAQFDNPYDIVEVTASHLDDFWHSVFDSLGGIYVSPSEIYWYNTIDYPGPSSNACGEVPLGTAVYCPLDMSISIDDEFFWDVFSDYGDFAVASVVAHEWAHHIQFLVYDPNVRFDPAARIAFELQADCITGLHTRNFAEIGWLDETDALEAYILAASQGDDVMGVPLLAWGHGSALDRTNAFLTGYTLFTFAACGLPF